MNKEIEEQDDSITDQASLSENHSVFELTSSFAVDIAYWSTDYFKLTVDSSLAQELSQKDYLNEEEWTEFLIKNNVNCESLVITNNDKTINEEVLRANLPVLAFPYHQKNAYVFLARTLGHWQVYDIEQRRAIYLSNKEVDDLQLYDTYAMGVVDQAESESVEPSDSIWDSFIFKEVIKHKAVYRDALIASIVINLVAIFIPLYTMNVYDKVVPNLAFNTLWVLSSIVLIGLAFDWVLKQSRSLLTDRVGQHIDRVLSVNILRRIMDSKSENIPTSVGSMSKSFQDFDGVRDFLNSVTITALVDLPFTIFFLLVVFIVAGPIVIAPIVVMAVILVMTVMAQRKVKENVKRMSEVKAGRSALSFEILQTLDTLKLNGAKQWMIDRWREQVNQCADASFASSHHTTKISHTAQFLQQCMTVVVIVVGVYMISAGQLTMGALIATMMIGGRAAGSVMQISTLITRFQNAKEGVSSINQLLSTPRERIHEDVKIERKSFHGLVNINNVSFQYPQCETYALKDINIMIKPGERVALLGGIGSGKSTLIKLIETLYLPTSGRILYDNLDAKFWDVDLLRNHIAAVDQHPKLFKGSLFANITVGSVGPVSEHRLNQAIDQSGLGMVLPKIEGGLEKTLGENNSGISGGQAQSIALARAFIKRAKLFIFDEPTSMMDKSTEMKVLKSLKSLPSSCTLILSTHNLNLLSAVDRVIILDQGKIKFDGPVDTLKKAS